MPGQVRQLGCQSSGHPPAYRISGSILDLPIQVHRHHLSHTCVLGTWEIRKRGQTRFWGDKGDFKIIGNFYFCKENYIHEPLR